MHKPHILWKHQAPTRASLKLGWNNLSRNGKTLLILANLLFICGAIYNGFKQASGFSFLISAFSVVYPTILFLTSKGFPTESLGSMMDILKVEKNSIWVGDYQLPETVRKAAIGRMDIQGPAYLQLAWNGGRQWIFHIEELQQVRHFFRQHAPQIEILNE